MTIVQAESCNVSLIAPRPRGTDLPPKNRKIKRYGMYSQCQLLCWADMRCGWTTTLRVKNCHSTDACVLTIGAASSRPQGKRRAPVPQIGDDWAVRTIETPLLRLIRPG
jgi:hypothetical protein